MRVNELFEDVKIDNVRGAGAVPYNQEVDYFGFRVMMRPSKFLELALPISRNDASNADGLKDHIKGGGAIASPLFTLAIPSGWSDGDFSERAQIKSHEGRNRMIAIMELEGDVPVEVHFVLSGGLRGSNIKPEWMNAMSKWLDSEDGSVVFRPFDSVIW